MDKLYKVLVAISLVFLAINVFDLNRSFSDIQIVQCEA
jgi:hypothetical protein